MSDITIGDKVRITNRGFSFTTYERMATEMGLSRYTYTQAPRKDGPYRVVAVRKHHFCNDILAGISDGENDFIISVAGLEVIPSGYPNQPRKHRDLIIAWANGADIEVLGDTDMTKGQWSSSSHPSWSPFRIYRIKPQKTEAEIKKENIIKKIDELKKELEDL